MDKQKQAILKISDELLTKLLEFKEQHPGFTFSFRSRDSNMSEESRLLKGQWFQGSDYICVPLFKTNDPQRRIKTFGFVINFDSNGNVSDNYVQVSFKGVTNQVEIEFHRSLVEEMGAIYLNQDRDLAKWYPEDDDYLKVFDYYLRYTRDVALSLLAKYELEDKYIISQYDFERSLLRVEAIRERLNASPINNNLQLATMYINTILYGPPGTGKTYKTILHAAQIIKGESFENRYNEALGIYKKLLGTQIEFVTFHQNYSYEDFVAGLKPDIDASSIGLRFKEHKGIFYRICKMARDNYLQHTSGQTYIEPSFEQVLDHFLEPLATDDEIEVLTIARNVSFHITANNGKNLSFRKQGGGTDHTLSISTLKELYENKREYSLQGLGIYFRPVVDKLREVAKTLRKEIGKIPLKNYVLIIDEINRANISRVFGELITLLEPDKRLGAKHEIQLTLPGLPNDEKFTVPKNLYIIGTMNTADKSIALLDIALRRRFHFQPMYPDPSIEGVQHGNLLERINEQILTKRGADFLIGHAYFMKDENGQFDLEETMNHKVIPLLSEYFYNQREGIVKSIIGNAIIDNPAWQVDYDKYRQLKFTINGSV